jgi:hypothetical protein
VSDHFLILRSKGSGPFGSPVLSIVHEQGGTAEIVAYLETEQLGRRIVALLNRNGLEDVPLPMLEEETE